MSENLPAAEEFTRAGHCAECGDVAIADGERAGVRAGRLLCSDCADETVVYVVECLDCEWSYRWDDTTFNWYHARQRVQQEGNSHESTQRVFEDESHETVWRRSPTADGGES